MSVDPAIVEWLKEGVYYSRTDDAAQSARWGALCTDTVITSPLAFKAGADAEGARQLALLGGPLVEDEHLVPGDRKDLRLRCITVVIDQLGYDQGVRAFVLGTEPAEGNMTKLTVLRKL